MNQRILELAEQCYGYNSTQIDVEKFAELIIQECIGTVSDCSVDYCTRPQIISEIKQHFGVEE